MLGRVERVRVLGWACGAVGVFVAILAACSTASTNHPGGVGECGPGIHCIGIGAPGGFGGGSVTLDAAVDGDAAPGETGDASDTGVAVDTGDASADVPEGGPTTLSIASAEVHASPAATHDPSTDPLDTADIQNTWVTVGGVLTTGSVSAGLFAIPKVDAIAGKLSWIVLLHRDTAGTTTARTVEHVLFDGTTTTIAGPLHVPAYDPALRDTMAAAVAVPSAAPATATLIVQVIDATGAPLAGVTGAFPGALTTCSGSSPCGPYYDSGDTVIVNPAGTGPRGTIVFFNVPATTIPGAIPTYVAVSVTASGKPTVTLPEMLAISDAYSFVRWQLK